VTIEMIPKRKKSIALFHVVGAFALLLSALPISTFARPLFDSWTLDNGLPQNSVYSILQTRDGYLWFTTLNGLVRSDGANFTVFDKSNSPGIGSNRFTTLYEDTEGSLWIGTEGNGLTRLKNGGFATYVTNVNSAYNNIYSIQEESGTLWLLTEGGLAHWQNGILSPYLPEGSDQPSIGSEPNDLLKDTLRNSGTAFADAAGLQVVRDGQLATLTTADGLSSLKINSLYKDGRGDLWAGTEDAGLNRLRDGKITVYTTKDGLPNDHISITAASEDRSGNLWFAIFGSPGLYRLKQGKVTHYGSTDGLSGDKVRSIYEDREGNVWVGMADGGINRFKDEAITAYSKADGLLADNTYPILEDSTGAVWIGTWPGLNKYEGGKFTNYTKSDGLPSEIITALYEDREGTLWVGTYGRLSRFKDGQFTTFQVLGADEAGWGVLDIHQDRSGALWFGTTSGLFRHQNGELKHFTTIDGLPHPQVIVMHEDGTGGLWLGTRGGLAYMKDGKFTVYTENEGLSSNHVRSFYEDQEGILWIGTYDGGLNRFKDGRFVRYSVREGLFDNGVFQILDDGRGNFWMSSNHGVYRASRRELEDFAAGRIRSITSVGYGTGDGMLIAECNGGSQPAGTRTRDGRLWFPTQQGVVVINPEAIRMNPLPPPVLIHEIRIDNRKAQIGEAGLSVGPGDERFEIRYTALSFVKPGQVRFKYKLEGLDEDWIEAGGRRTANYSYVPPGDYVFHVIAANSDNVWNEEGAKIKVSVVPPFYRRSWFIALTALLIVVVIFAAYRRRISQLEKARAVQQAFSRQLIASQEQERKRIAAELHDSLGQRLVVIKNLALMLLHIDTGKETSRERIEGISNEASQALGEVQEISYNLRPYQLDRIGLTKAVEAIVDSAETASTIEFSADIDDIDDYFPPELKINFYRIVQECVGNLVKHSGATEAFVKIELSGENLLLEISDNGKGFTPGKTESKTGGFGLIGLAERTELLGGNIEIISAPNQGTTIRIKLNSRKFLQGLPTGGD